jgi:hypothetical protein
MPQVRLAQILLELLRPTERLNQNALALRPTLRVLYHRRYELIATNLRSVTLRFIPPARGEVRLPSAAPQARPRRGQLQRSRLHGSLRGHRHAIARAAGEGFRKLHKRSAEAGELHLWVFDVLALSGKDMRLQPLRKDRLQGLLARFDCPAVRRWDTSNLLQQ